MPGLICAFLLGDLLLQSLPQLPNIHFLYFLFLALICLYFLRNHSYLIKLILATLIGFLWTAYYATNLLAWSLPHEFESRPILITGYIASLPVSDQNGTHFIFAIKNIQPSIPNQSPETTILLRWRTEETIHVGDEWQFTARLKRIHATQNPGSFDFEAWAIQNGLRASGYVVPNTTYQLRKHAYFHYPLNQIRAWLLKKLQPHLPATDTAPWLIALILGERVDIPQSSWQVLRKTGTNHLMAIAGLHIGLLAMLIHSLVAFIWRRVPNLCLLLPAQQAGAFAGLLFALLYSTLAGFSLPTQRACIMLSVFVYALLSRRRINAWHTWSLALISVLLINPLSVLSDSFWLSFGTIALIIYGMSGRLAPSGWWWQWGRVQWVIALGLTPLSLALFQETSLLGFLVNSVAIPWLGFLVLPFCWLALLSLWISPNLTTLWLLVADKSLAGLWTFLAWCAQSPFSHWQHALTQPIPFLLTLLAVLLLLLPRGLPGRWLSLIYLLPLFFWTPARPASRHVWLTLLDVGQGLSVVVQTTHHTLVYDAGPKYSARIDLGENVVLPYLRTLGTKQIDMLVVSHGDNDHIGGAQAILHSMPVLDIRTSVKEKMLPYTAEYCLTNQTWQWDGVTFTFLYPDKDNLYLTNDSSCVLRIDNGHEQILLTGDIEKHAENNLLAQYPRELRAQLIIAPHHGSKTSGVKKFIHAVQPTYVLYATAYRNRYHFPHASVVSAYEAMHAKQLNTADTGAMEFKLTPASEISPPYLYRIQHHRYWFD